MQNSQRRHLVLLPHAHHVHLIAVPGAEQALSIAIGEAHRRYTRYINFQKDWRGHLWQGRFSSFPTDERHLLAAARYIELNPVRAKLVDNPEDYPWSSCKAHLQGKGDPLVNIQSLLDLSPNWQELLGSGFETKQHEVIRKHEKTGRPLVPCF